MRVLRYAALGLVLAAPLVFGFLASAPLRIYPGPADEAYSVELPSRYRVGEPSFFRWLGRGGLDLPFRLEAPGVLRLDYQIATPALVEVTVDGRPAGQLQLSPGRSTAQLVLPESSLLRLRFLEGERDADDRRRASFFLLQVESSRIVPTLRAVLPIVALPALLGGLLLLARMSATHAFLFAVGASFVEAFFLGRDPYATVRLVERLLAPVALWGGVFALAFRRRAASSWIYAAFLTGTLLRLAIVLHPSAYHYDHAAHAGMVQALLDRGIAGFWEVRQELQLQLNVGEIHIGGEKRAFPYPTFFFLATGTLARIVGSVDYAMMVFSSLVSSLEVLFVAALAGVLLKRSEGRVYASWAAALYPASFGVLTIVLYPTMVAHVAEVGALALLARHGESSSKSGTFAVVAAIAFAASIHAGTFTNLALFFPIFALVTWRARPLVLGAAGLGFSFLLSYRHYWSLVPIVLQSPSEAPFSIYWLQLEPPQQFAFMGGYLWPLLGLVGLVLLRSSSGRRFLLAWGLSFLVMRGLRVGLGPPGAHLKELQWVAPLVALGVGEALSALAVRRRVLAVGAVGILLALTGRWLVEHQRWILPVLRVTEAEGPPRSEGPPALPSRSVGGHGWRNLGPSGDDFPGAVLSHEHDGVEALGRRPLHR